MIAREINRALNCNGANCQTRDENQNRKTSADCMSHQRSLALRLYGWLVVDEKTGRNKNVEQVHVAFVWWLWKDGKSLRVGVGVGTGDRQKGRQDLCRVGMDAKLEQASAAAACPFRPHKVKDSWQRWSVHLVAVQVWLPQSSY